MKNVKPVSTSLVFLLLILLGCTANAFARDKNATNSPAVDYKKEFLEPYWRFITDQEKKAFKKLTTNEEKEEFINHFWEIRDTDPSTPENEFKMLIDERINDIKKEILFSDPDLAGVRFSSEGGLNGKMAQVYLLHGMPPPHHKFKLFNGHYHVDLMVWLYPNSAGNRVKYLFIFYKRNNSGHFDIFYPNFNLIDGLKEISVFLYATDLQNTYDELVRDYPAGQLVLRGLTRFSDFMDMNLGKALEPPKPAALVAEKSKPLILGRPEIKKNQEIVRNKFYSFIPARFHIIISGILGSSQKSFAFGLYVAYGNLDWRVDGDKLECILELKVILQNVKTKKIYNHTEIISLSTTKDEHQINQEKEIYVTFTDLNNLVNHDLPAGTYRLDIYLKDNLTLKYNTWLEQIIK